MSMSIRRKPGSTALSTGALKTPSRTAAAPASRSLASGTMSTRKRGRHSTAGLQDDQNTISVMVRVRPPHTKNAGGAASCVDIMDEDKLLITAPQGLKNDVDGSTKLQQYLFTRVFPEETTQSEYYNESAAPLVDAMVNQHSNYVMLAYGITGSGKTFTLEGEGGNIGVLPRAIEHLFEKLASCEQREGLAVCVSYYEVYNEHIIDLLTPAAKGVNAKQLKVTEDASGSICIPGLSVHVVGNWKEAIALQTKGTAQRSRSGTKQKSSRSHSVFTIQLCKCKEQENCANAADPSEGLHALSRLSFVDMAGAERHKEDATLKINGSLLALGRCLEALRHNQKNPSVAPQLIPFRTSKITHIFRDVLHGKGRIMLAVHVSPDECDYSETQHMLEYARAATEIKTVHMPLAPQTVVHASIAVTMKRRRMFPESSKSQSGGVFAGRMTRAAQESLKGELESTKLELVEVRKTAAEVKLQVRRELTRKMQLKLEETEAMWGKKHDALLAQLESLTASNKALLTKQACGTLSEEEAAAAQETLRVELREEVKLELEHRHQREMDLVKESMVCELLNNNVLSQMDQSGRNDEIAAMCRNLSEEVAEKVHLLEQRNAETEQQKAEVEGKLVELQAHLDTCEAQRQKDLDVLMEELHALMQDKDQSDALTQQELEKFKERAEELMPVREQLENLKRKFDVEVEAKAAAMREELETLKDQYTQELEDAAGVLQDLEEQLEQSEEANAAQAETHRQEVAALQAQHQKELAELKRVMVDEDMEEAEENTAASGRGDLEQLEEELEEKNRQQRELMEKLQCIEREQEAAQAAHEQQLAALEAAYAEKLAAAGASGAPEATASPVLAPKEAPAPGADAAAAEAAEAQAEVEVLREQNNQLKAQLEAMTREKAMLLDNHDWEIKLIKENANLDVRGVDHLTAELEEMLTSKQALMERLVAVRKEKAALESEHLCTVDQLKIQVEADDVLRAEMRKQLEAQLDEEYTNKVRFIQMTAADDDMFLVMQMQALDREKQALKKKLESAERERDHLTECMAILQADQPELFQEQGCLHQSMDAAAWADVRSSMSNISALRSSMNLRASMSMLRGSGGWLPRAGAGAVRTSLNTLPR